MGQCITKGVSNCSQDKLEELAAVVLMATVMFAAVCFNCCRERTDSDIRAGGASYQTSMTSSISDSTAARGFGRILSNLGLYSPKWQSLGMINFPLLRMEATPMASGGGGVVYKGRYLGQPVAIKALYSQM